MNVDPRSPWRRRSLPRRRRRAQRILAAIACLSPASLLPTAAFADTASINVDPGAAVRIYGAAGTFGQLASAPVTPTGQPLLTVPVDGWGFLPGQAAYFPTVAPDGTIVIANEPQTDNQLMPTARQMALTTFDPASRRFANTVVPTSTDAPSSAARGPRHPAWSAAATSRMSA